MNKEKLYWEIYDDDDIPDDEKRRAYFDAAIMDDEEEEDWMDRGEPWKQIHTS